MKVSVELRKKNKEPHLGRLNIRISNKSKNKYKSLGVDINFKYWNKEKQRVKKSYKDSYEINTLIEESLSKYRLSGVKGIEEVNVIAIDYFRKIKKRYKESTQIAASYPLNTFERYLKEINSESITLKDLNNTLMLDFKKHLEHKELNNNSIRTIFAYLNTFINIAIDEDIVNYYRHPTRGIKIKSVPTKSTYLNREEFNKYINYIPKDSWEEICINIFTFQVATQGIRISDALLLKIRDFEYNKYISVDIITVKAKKAINVRLNNLSLKAIDKYIWKNENDSEYIKLKNDIDIIDNDISLLEEAIDIVNTGGFKSSNDFKSRKEIRLNRLVLRDSNSLIIEKDMKVEERLLAVHKMYWYRIEKTDKNRPLFKFNYTFDNYKKGGDLSTIDVRKKAGIINSIKLRLDRITNKLGLKKINTHSARHTYTMLAQDSGMSLDNLSASLTHYSQSTTKAYLHKLNNNKEINRQTGDLFNNL